MCFHCISGGNKSSLWNRSTFLYNVWKSWTSNFVKIRIFLILIFEISNNRKQCDQICKNWSCTNLFTKKWSKWLWFLIPLSNYNLLFNYLSQTWTIENCISTTKIKMDVSVNFKSESGNLKCMKETAIRPKSIKLIKTIKGSSTQRKKSAPGVRLQLTPKQ